MGSNTRSSILANRLILITDTETYADLTLLTPLPQNILQLLNFPVEIYTCLGPQSDDPP